jgi:hypothetical protein
MMRQASLLLRSMGTMYIWCKKQETKKLPAISCPGVAYSGSNPGHGQFISLWKQMAYNGFSGFAK